MSNINTSLQILFEICQNTSCTGFTIQDITGVYSSVNLTAWGLPNPELTDVDTCTLEVQDINGDTLDTFDLLTLSSGTFPNTSDTPLTISTAYDDGVYTFIYTCSGNTIGGTADVDWSSTKTITMLFKCQTQCCLDALLSTITTDDCTTCNNTTLDKVVKANTYLESGVLAACCGSKKRALKLLNAAKFLCNSTNCKNC